MVDKVFYNSKGDAVSVSYVEDVQQLHKGNTKDGNPIYHTTYFKDGKHISYDTVVVRGEHCYIRGSGHETNHYGGEITRWDLGNRVTWQEAVDRMYTRDLIDHYHE